MSQQPHKLNESLLGGDLKDYINNVFTVDHYKSKMGEDQDVVVVGFRVKEKSPASDLVEFIEKGYPFVLDADMSSGEEHDGQYQVFVEFERNDKLSSRLKDLLGGVSKLTDCYNWRFRYQKSKTSFPFDEESIMEQIPMSPDAYTQKINEIKTVDIQEFFDQGTTDVTLEGDNTLIFSKPYAGDIDVKFVSIGDYDDVKQTIPGALSLDESSQSQVTFLNKYLGNYDINKIGDKFLIRNGSRAIVIQKTRW
jgi:hypothetical protein